MVDMKRVIDICHRSATFYRIMCNTTYKRRAVKDFAEVSDGLRGGSRGGMFVTGQKVSSNLKKPPTTGNLYVTKKEPKPMRLISSGNINWGSTDLLDPPPSEKSTK